MKIMGQLTNEEALDELNVIYKRLSHPEDCEQGVYSFRDGDYLEALDKAMEALELMSHLKDRPCSACEYHKENGCCKWTCVFEK